MEQINERYMDKIPDYLMGRLKGQALREFEDALRRDPELSAAVEEEKALRDGLYRMAQEICPNRKAILAKIETNIGEKLSSETPTHHSLHRIGEWLRGLLSAPRLAWGLCALEAVALLVLLISHGPRFQTMSSSRIRTPNKIVFNVIFKDKATVPQMVTFLKKHGARIIDGPGHGGVFLVEVPRPQSAHILVRSSVVEFARPAY